VLDERVGKARVQPRAAGRPTTAHHFRAATGIRHAEPCQYKAVRHVERETWGVLAPGNEPQIYAKFGYVAGRAFLKVARASDGPLVLAASMEIHSLHSKQGRGCSVTW
jgi:hypothetical protein